MLISARNPIVDKLLILAGGSLDRVNEAICEAAGGGKSANLADIVKILTRKSALAKE